MEGIKIRKIFIQSQGQQFSNYIYTFEIDRSLDVTHPFEFLPYQIETNNGYQAYLNGSPDMLQIFISALNLEENYYTVMNLCVLYLAQRDFKTLDELKNKACRLANGQTHHVIFVVEMNLFVHDYDQAIIKLLEIFDDPEQNEVVMALLQQIFNSKLYSKQHLQTLTKDDNIIQKLITINKRFFINDRAQQYESLSSNQSQLRLTNISNKDEVLDYQHVLLQNTGQVLNSLSKQSFEQLREGKQVSLSQATEKTEQLSFISEKQEERNQIGPSIDFTFIDIVIENPRLFSFQLRIPYMIGSYDIKEMNKLEQKIAEGGFGAVYVSKNLINNEIHAVKVIKEQEDQNVNLILQEIIIQDKIQQLNPNLFLNLKPLIYLKKQNKLVDIYIPLELAQFSLYDYLREVEVDEEEYIYFYNLFIDFIVTLHENNYAHRDIKPQNILFVKDVGWKLADFGESIKYTQVDDLYKIRGTLAFLPSGVRKQQKLQDAIKQNLLYNDVYAAVCTLILIQNPNLNSKGLIEFMDKNQFNERQSLFLQNFHDLQTLKLLKNILSQTPKTKIIKKKQIQEQLSSWACLERFQFCQDQQIPLDDDLIQELDKMLGNFIEKQQTNQLILYGLLISNSFPFQIEKFNYLLNFNLHRHYIVEIAIQEGYSYIIQILRYLSITKLYNLLILLCDQIMKIDYQVIIHLYKIEALRTSNRINEAKLELQLAYRYMLQVKSYSLDEQILFVELQSKLHDEVPQIKLGKQFTSFFQKINNKNKVQSQYHDPDERLFLSVNSHLLNEKKYLQIKLDELLKNNFINFTENEQSSTFQSIIEQFGTQFLVDGQLTNTNKLIEYIKENLIFWNTVYHQKIHVIAVGLNQIFQYYGKYQEAYQVGIYFYVILKNLGSWKGIFDQYEEFLNTQSMLFHICNNPIEYYIDTDNCQSELKYLSLFDNIYLFLRLTNYGCQLLAFNKNENYLFVQLSNLIEGIDVIIKYIISSNASTSQKNTLKAYLHKLLINLLNPCQYTILTLRLVKKIQNFLIKYYTNNIVLKNCSILQLDQERQPNIVSLLIKTIIKDQMQMSKNSIKQHSLYYKTISTIHYQIMKIINRQKMLGSFFKISLFVSQENKFNSDVKYYLWSQQQLQNFKATKITQITKRKIDQINLFQQFIQK